MGEGDQGGKIKVKMKKIKVQAGDLCAIPLGNGEYAFAQLIDNLHQHCYVIYDYKGAIYPDLKELIKNKIIILTYTVDVFIDNGRWPLIGNISPPTKISIPNYIVGKFENGKEKIKVVDNHGNYLREATVEDKKKLSYQTSVSPAVLENVARFKLLGIGRYRPYMEALFYKVNV